MEEKSCYEMKKSIFNRPDKMKIIIDLNVLVWYVVALFSSRDF